MTLSWPAPTGWRLSVKGRNFSVTNYWLLPSERREEFLDLQLFMWFVCYEQLLQQQIFLAITKGIGDLKKCSVWCWGWRSQGWEKWSSQLGLRSRLGALKEPVAVLKNQGCIGGTNCWLPDPHLPLPAGFASPCPLIWLFISWSIAHKVGGDGGSSIIMAEAKETEMKILLLSDREWAQR